MEEKKIVELLPKGKFIIHQQSGDSVKPLKGRFSMYVLDRFCIDKKIESYITLLQKIMVGMTVGEYADLIKFALDDYHRDQDNGCGLSRRDIMDLIDETLDGISSEHFDGLIKHAIGRVANLKKLEDAAEKLTAAQEEEKKSDLNVNSTDTTSGNDATRQD